VLLDILGSHGYFAGCGQRRIEEKSMDAAGLRALLGGNDWNISAR
jgi:hypothetical protein